MNRIGPSVALILALLASAIHTEAQNQTIMKRKPGKGDPPVTIQGPPPLVQGTGTIGQIPKWINFTGSNYVVGDSVMTENNGQIGIGTPMPTSKLTVARDD